MKAKQNILICTIIMGVFIVTANGCKEVDDNHIDNTFTDPRDGNVYKTVTIGNQEWMAENLRYIGNIPQIKDNEGWEAISTNSTEQPAWCYYDNKPGNDMTYGKLYNWHAVNTGTICPEGWHIPSEAEWSQLVDFLGGAGVAGSKMKSTTGWDSPNSDATNASGFSGIPGGVRWSDGVFIMVGRLGNWWSSTEGDFGSAMTLHLSYGEGIARSIWDDKNQGYSCRCLRD